MDAARSARLRSMVLCLVFTVVGCTAPGGGHASSGGQRPTGAVSDLAAVDVEYADGHRLDVHVPRTSPAEGLPTVVMLHGCCGDRTDVVKLAESTAAAGTVVLNADWPGTGLRGRHPQSYAVAACAVRFARDHAASYGADPERVTVAGWSDGALAASMTTFAPGALSRQPCRSATPVGDVRLVGLDGFYGWRLPVVDRHVTARSIRFVGGDPQAVPSRWQDATPYHWIERAPARTATLIVGSTSPLLPDARRFARALDRVGHVVDVVTIGSAPGSSPLSTRTCEGRLAARTLAAAAGAAGVGQDVPGCP